MAAGDFLAFALKWLTIGQHQIEKNPHSLYDSQIKKMYSFIAIFFCFLFHEATLKILFLFQTAHNLY